MDSEGSQDKKKKAKDKVEIREIELEDLAPVYALGEKLFTADLWSSLHRTWDEYEVLNLYMTDGDTCFVAILDDEVVGFALGAMIEKRRSSWKYGYMLWLGVSPVLKGMGIGKKLVKRLTDAFINEGARIMLVDTDGENDDAIEFFHRIGFGQDQRHVYLSMNLTKLPKYEKHRAKKDEDKPKKKDEHDK
ncbi:GNAT family N-acetyltransferase [Microvenator marinus]|uniref:GNAT family N-acetyltransferase n=1 Tax=Microvenator marinus TaxID=2600177 RepID=A0A5B8XZD0_9DELT|nr:GNAT family N-acetyltransferase [Microvenator marinus]QED29026.1 GNAT family N-acetyltransferase [Microvenator marinus]